MAGESSVTTPNRARTAASVARGCVRCIGPPLARPFHKKMPATEFPAAKEEVILVAPSATTGAVCTTRTTDDLTPQIHRLTPLALAAAVAAVASPPPPKRPIPKSPTSSSSSSTIWATPTSARSAPRPTRRRTSTAWPPRAGGSPTSTPPSAVCSASRVALLTGCYPRAGQHPRRPAAEVAASASTRTS